MVKIRQAIVVEGKYDQNTLSQLVDTTIFQTHGFGVMHDKALLSLLRRAAQTITISGLKASYDVDPQWDVALSGTDPDADAALLEGFALIHNYKTGANSLTAQCIGKAPTINIPIKVVVFG